jgi:ATP-dependent protease ClpP protease subunit
MIHEISGMSYGKNQEIQSSSKQADKINRKLIATLAADCKKDYKQFHEQIHKLKNADWFLGTAEAKAWGIIDHAMIPRFTLFEQQIALQVPSSYKSAKKPKSTPKKTQKPTKARK